MFVRCLIVAASAALISSTGFHEPAQAAPTAAADQTVATIAGEPITAADLQLERQAASLPGADDKAINQAALKRIIARRLMAAEAKKQGLDKAPEVQAQMRRGVDALLAQMYERQQARAAPDPTDADIQAFIVGHPELFAQRRILIVTQLTAAPKNTSIERFKPLRTMEEIKRLLDSEQTPYQEMVSSIDSLTADPQTLKALMTARPNEVFVTPGKANSLVFGEVIQSRLAPIGGPPATTYAAAALRQQRGRDAARVAFEALLKNAAGSFHYADGYAPE